MVANEYAKALYELAQENKKEVEFKKYFPYVLEILKDEDVYKVLTSPFIETNKKKDLIKNAFNVLDEIFLNFLYVLIDNNRFSIIDEIEECYNKHLLDENDIVQVNIVSAQKLNKSQLEHFTKSLEKKYEGKKLEIENIINPDLIGGIQIEANGESIDLSLRNSLIKLKESL